MCVCVCVFAPPMHNLQITDIELFQCCWRALIACRIEPRTQSRATISREIRMETSTENRLEAGDSHSSSAPLSVGERTPSEKQQLRRASPHQTTIHIVNTFPQYQLRNAVASALPVAIGVGHMVHIWCRTGYVLCIHIRFNF